MGRIPWSCDYPLVARIMRVSVMTPKCRRGGGQVHEEERGSLAETLDSILDRKHCDWRTNQLRLSRCLFGDPDLIVAIIFVTMATCSHYHSKC